MNKTKLLKVSTLVAGVLVAGVVSAALVTFLSNEVLIDPTLKSPVELTLYGKQYVADPDAWHTDWIDLNKTVGSDLYAGSYYEIKMNGENRANQNVKGYLEVNVQPVPNDVLYNIELGDIDLKLFWWNGTTWVETGFPCQTDFSFDNGGYYYWNIEDITPGVEEFKVGIDFDQALDTAATYDIKARVYDPDVAGTTNVNVGECPW